MAGHSERTLSCTRQGITTRLESSLSVAQRSRLERLRGAAYLADNTLARERGRAAILEDACSGRRVLFCGDAGDQQESSVLLSRRDGVWCLSVLDKIQSLLGIEPVGSSDEKIRFLLSGGDVILGAADRNEATFWLQSVRSILFPEVVQKPSS
jgi:hypothetical protein